MDSMAGDTDNAMEGRWLSYQELAELRQIDKQSALKLALRRKWSRRKDNHGIMHVMVPHEWLTPPRQYPPAMQATMHATTEPDMPGAVQDSMTLSMAVVQQFEAALSTLREQLERANTRISGLEAGNAGLQADLNAAQEAVRRAEAALDRVLRGRQRPKGEGALAPAPGGMAWRIGKKQSSAADDLRRAVRKASTRRANAARRLRSLWTRLRAARRGE